MLPLNKMLHYTFNSKYTFKQKNIDFISWYKKANHNLNVGNVMKKLFLLMLTMLFNGLNGMNITGPVLTNGEPFLTPIQGVSPSMTEFFCVATTNIPNLGSNNSTLLQGQVYPEPQYLLAQYVPGQVVNGVQVVQYSNGLSPQLVCKNIHENLDVQFVGVQPLAQLPNTVVNQTSTVTNTVFNQANTLLRR